MVQKVSSQGARLALAAVLALSLAACGGGSDNDKDNGTGGDSGTPVLPADPGTPAPPADPGTPAPPVDPGNQGVLQGATLLGTIPVADITAAVAEKDSRVQNLQPRYAVTSYKLEYLTIGAQGQSVLASGMVSVPVKPAGAKSPVLSYQHGTIFHDAEAPSNNAVASEVAVVMASLGYIVLAPDYVGYGTSKGTPHPYLLSTPSAAAVVDFLTAAKTWRAEQGVADNQQLFLTGYSEGGYVTMAAHRALQTSNSTHLAQLRAVVPGAGPYNVQVTLDSLINLVRKENRVVGALINPGFLRYLGGSVQREVRRALLRELMPDDADTVMDYQFLDNFFADDVNTIARISNVHDWKPQVPVYLYHGRDDRTVPYASSTSTLAAMQAQGAGELVSLTDCPAVPASHIGCVPPFMNFMLGKLAPIAQDL